MTAELTIPAPRGNGAEVFFKVALGMGVLVAGLEVGYLIYSPLPYDPVGYLIGRDFVNTWLGGQLALTGDPGAYFGPDAYNGLLAERFGPSYPRHIWSYPPPFLLFTWPFGLLPYIPAYVLYTLIGLITYLAVACEGRRPSAQELLLLILAPAVIVNIWCGQTGFFVAALLIGGLVSFDRRPILAGVLFGLLCIKPQLGLLLPLMLALTGRWRVIGAAAATIAALVAAATISFGPNVWTAYVNDAMPTQGAVVAKSFEHFMAHMPTAFMNARVAGFSMPVAIAAQIVLSAAAVAAVVWTFWRARERDLSNMLLVTATFVATPYAFNYDMVVFGWVAIKLMRRSDSDAWDFLLMLAVWATPFLTVPSGMAGLPISVLPMLALGGRLVWRIWDGERDAGRRGTGAAALADAALAST
jgi:alpha-1,2-mannosyltransferase